MKRSKGTDWTIEQRKLAFHLYCQLPFGRLHSRNPQIIELADLIGRTPGAVAMKLVNFASLDPKITSTGRHGLRGKANADLKIWEEFNGDWEGLAMECEKRIKKLRRERGVVETVPVDEPEIAIPESFIGETKRVLREYRVKQRFFRRVVVSSYDGACCMSGIAEPKLLVASHIVPWSKDRENRLNPRNGLCLSALHDKAFDALLITVTPDFFIKVSKKLQKYRANDCLRESLLALHGKAIKVPRRFPPHQEFLALHNEIFELAQKRS